MNPIILYSLAKARQSDLLREADQHRLLRQARTGQPSVIARILQKLGGLLIKIGGQLQERHASQSTRTLGWAEK